MIGEFSIGVSLWQTPPIQHEVTRVLLSITHKCLVTFENFPFSFHFFFFKKNKNFFFLGNWSSRWPHSLLDV